MDHHELDAPQLAGELQTALAKLLKRHKITIRHDADPDDLAVLYCCLEEALVAAARISERQLANGSTLPIKVTNTLEEMTS